VNMTQILSSGLETMKNILTVYGVQNDTVPHP
jgi:hypothetical protein